MGEGTRPPGRPHRSASATGYDHQSQLHVPGVDRALVSVSNDHAACAAGSGDLILTEDLPFAFHAGMDAQAVAPGLAQPSQSLEELLRTAERRIVEATLAACRGNKAEAARRLRMTRPSFYRRLKTLGLHDGDQRLNDV